MANFLNWASRTVSVTAAGSGDPNNGTAIPIVSEWTIALLTGSGSGCVVLPNSAETGTIIEAYCEFGGSCNVSTERSGGTLNGASGGSPAFGTITLTAGNNRIFRKVGAGDWRTIPS